MNTAYLLTGGNLGNIKVYLAMAASLIEEKCGKITNCSSLYKTAAWGKTDQQDFINQALQISTALSPAKLLHQVLSIEKKIGRERNEKYGPRIIDIDILFFNDNIISRPSLTVPHPQMQNRKFVLKPLSEIASGYLHPVFKKTVKQLLKECPDTLAVRKIR